MNWINSRKSFWTCFADIVFAVMTLFLMSSCDVPASINTLVPTDTPVPTATYTLAPTDTPMPTATIAAVPTDTPTIASPPTVADISTRSYPTPILVSPAFGETITGTILTRFFWRWEGDLQEKERFDLQIWRSEKTPCTIAMPGECSHLLDTPPDGFGQYKWQVAVIEVDESGNKSTLCESLAWPFVWNDEPPDAIVNAEALNLRSGPGVVYDVLGVLKRGDPLKVTGRNPASNWLKVICPDEKEGWTACSLLRVNVDMDDVPVAQIPPTPTPIDTPTPTATPTPDLLPPPILTEPENGAAFIGGPVILKWQWDRPRAPDEIFSVRVRKEGETELCHHNKARDLDYWGDFPYCREGKHYWGVALVRRLEGCDDEAAERCWQKLSEPSAERWIYYTPGERVWTWPTPTPSGGGDGPCPGCRP